MTEPDPHDYYNLKDANGEPYSFTNMPPVEAVSALTCAAFTRAAPRTDGDDGELVERLREVGLDYDFHENALIYQAAARITALSTEVAEKDAALAELIKAANELSAEVLALGAKP
jgi:hypothetical protein